MNDLLSVNDARQAQTDVHQPAAGCRQHVTQGVSMI